MTIDKNAASSVSILGCTGSIGKNTINILQESPNNYRIIALTANKNAEQLIADAKAYHPEVVAIADESKYQQVKSELSPLGIKVFSGKQGLIDASCQPADWIMSAIVGEAGLLPTYHALRHGTIVAIANKESLVCGGKMIMNQASKNNTKIIPVDSEHSAIFQVLDSKKPENVEKLILTASGGPFRKWEYNKISVAKAEDALKHPNWDMGSKITIDSATMMNKGLEVIEAHYLFAMQGDKIEIVVHPESIIHSMVEYIDGSVLAQLGTPDMRTPIAVSLSWPERIKTSHKKLNLREIGQLNFESADHNRFPCLDLAYQALRNGNVATAVLNSANEVAVESYLNGKISFYQISELINDALNEFSSNNQEMNSPDDIIKLCEEVRGYVAL